MTATLTFDAATHTYRLGDRRLPGVTAILRAAGLMDDFAGIPEEYRERGSRIHRAIMYDIQGDLGDCDPADMPYVEAARLARKELRFTAEDVERLYGDGALGFATHIDAVGRIASDARWAIVNWKTSATVLPAYAIQMAGEAMALYGTARRVVRRLGIHLTADGRYSVRAYDDDKDFDVFLAALRIWQFKEETK